ncbi:MAG: glycoside hydrolase family 32 protein [Verrucomicrobiota bacterium]
MHQTFGRWFLAVIVAAAAPSSRSATTNDPIARAMAGVGEAIPRADADPSRPVYHFHAPARWMNDPNGPIYYQGYYHLFYQLNPFGDEWGHMHWGHARSRDLVHWQHLPVALWPSLEQGEEHVFSGCTVVTARGQPMIFYTSIAQGKPAENFAAQWAALGSKDLVTWRKHPDNPILTERLHAGTKVYDWRDPFIFQQRGSTYMVLGGNLNARKGGEAVVNLYRADNQALTQWTYLGVLFTHPNPGIVNLECPNFFKLGDAWVLVVSPHGPVEYFLGDFDVRKPSFTSRQTGFLDFGDAFYAPNSMTDVRGRRLLWGWVRGFKNPQGWNGCLSLPRVLEVDRQNRLRQKPAPELRKLRGDHFRLSDELLDAAVRKIDGVEGDCLEIYLEIELFKAAAFQLQLRRSPDGARFIPVSYDGVDLEVAGAKAAFELLPGEKTLKLHVFLDKSLLEVFANDHAVFTRVIAPGEQDLGMGLKAEAGAARIRSFHAWKLQPIW